MEYGAGKVEYPALARLGLLLQLLGKLAAEPFLINSLVVKPCRQLLLLANNLTGFIKKLTDPCKGVGSTMMLEQIILFSYLKELIYARKSAI